VKKREEHKLSFENNFLQKTGDLQLEGGEPGSRSAGRGPFRSTGGKRGGVVDVCTCRSRLEVQVETGGRQVKLVDF